MYIDQFTFNFLEAPNSGRETNKRLINLGSIATYRGQTTKSLYSCLHRQVGCWILSQVVEITVLMKNRSQDG